MPPPIPCAGDGKKCNWTWVSGGDTALQDTPSCRDPASTAGCRVVWHRRCCAGWPRDQGHRSWRGWQPRLSSLAPATTAPGAHECQGRQHCWDRGWHRVCRDLGLSAAAVTVPAQPAASQAGRHTRADKARAASAPLRLRLLTGREGRGAACAAIQGKKPISSLLEGDFSFSNKHTSNN